MEEKVRGALKETKRELENGEERKRGWWDMECREEKKKLKETMREWRSEGGRNIRKGRRNTERHVKGKGKRKTKDGRGKQQKQKEKARFGK